MVQPGLHESVYAECVAVELAPAGVGSESQVTMPVIYRGITIPLGLRADIIVENTIIFEIKAVATVWAASTPWNPVVLPCSPW